MQDFNFLCLTRRTSKPEAFVRMCLKYQIRRRDPPGLQRITVGVVAKHDDPADRRAGHDQTQTHLVDKQRPECDRKIDLVRKNTPQLERPLLLQTRDQGFKLSSFKYKKF